ncbi:MAG TPA: choice-of-anchor tandem repeat GloVer-containing protein [Rhizomicrobium sp.]
MASRSESIRLVGAFGLASTLWAASGTMPAYSGEKVIHTFQGGSDGASPYGGLVADKAGNLYGTTGAGGGSGCQGIGCGTVFKIAADGTETVLYAFQGGSDGDGPSGSLLRDKAGNFYGETSGGGNAGWGTVFKLAPDGTETVLYAFQGGSDGRSPDGSLLADKNGNLYGTTDEGGNYNGSACSEFGCGTVFKLQPNGNKITLYAFQGGSDGEGPNSELVMDASGNLYGTTGSGGSCSVTSYGCGTVFKIAPDGTETVLYVFQGGTTDGEEPEAGLIADSAGNLYGTTFLGGTHKTCNCGIVFRVSPSGSETVLYSFQGGSDGENPDAGLIMDKAANFYGTTSYGGTSRCHIGCGTVFKLAPDGTETVFYAFKGGRDAPGGVNPVAPLLHRGGLLYGTTPIGGANNVGVVFSVKK